MAIRYACPACKTSYVVDDWEAGNKSDCQKCGQRLQVPAVTPPRMKTVLGEIESSPVPPPPPARPARPTPPPLPAGVSRSEPVPMPSYLMGPAKKSGLRTGPIIAIAGVVFAFLAGGTILVAWIARKSLEPDPAATASATKKSEPTRKTPELTAIPRQEVAGKSAPKPSAVERVESPPPATALNQPLTGEQVYDKLVRSSVFIITPTGSGTGFVVNIDKRLLVTNFHVVGRETEVAILYPLYDKSGELITDASFYRRQGKEIAVRGLVIERDATRDLAMIQVERVQDKTLAVTLAAKPAATGSTLFSVGGSGIGENLLWRLTKGTVRGRVQRRQKAEFGTLDCMILETDAALNHGDSGGPVMNDRGELVAVVSHGLANQRQVSGNIDVEEVRKFVARAGAGR